MYEIGEMDFLSAIKEQRRILDARYRADAEALRLRYEQDCETLDRAMALAKRESARSIIPLPTPSENQEPDRSVTDRVLSFASQMGGDFDSNELLARINEEEPLFGARIKGQPLATALYQLKLSGKVQITEERKGAKGARFKVCHTVPPMALMSNDELTAPGTDGKLNLQNLALAIARTMSGDFPRGEIYHVICKKYPEVETDSETVGATLYRLTKLGVGIEQVSRGMYRYTPPVITTAEATPHHA